MTLFEALKRKGFVGERRCKEGGMESYDTYRNPNMPGVELVFWWDEMKLTLLEGDITQDIGVLANRLNEWGIL